MHATCALWVATVSLSHFVSSVTQVGKVRPLEVVQIQRPCEPHPRGEKPTELSVTQSTNFESAINLQTARALGVKAPPEALSIVDEAIGWLDCLLRCVCPLLAQSGHPAMSAL